MKTWIALRALLDSAEKDAGYGELDPISQRMLEWIAVRKQDDAPLYIQEVVMKSGIASPATVHKSIALLERLGYLRITVDDADTRRRAIALTTQAERVLRTLSQQIDRWAKSMAGAESARAQNRKD